MRKSEKTTLRTGAKFGSRAQIGDQDITTADQENYRDLQMVVRDLNFRFAGKHGIDFVSLPGGNVDNDTGFRYKLVVGALKMPSPLRVTESRELDQ